MMLPLASHVCMEVDSHMRCCCALSCGCCVGSNLVCAGPRRCRVFAIQGTGMGDSSTGPDYFRLRSARHVAASAQQCQDTAVPSHVADWLVCRDCSRHSAWQHVQQLVWHAALCCEPSRHRSGTCTHAAPIVVSRHGDTMMVATAWLVIINHPSPDVLSTSCHGAPAAAAQHSHTQLQLRMMPCETCCCSWAFKAESCHCCQAQFVCYTTGTQPVRADDMLFGQPPQLHHSSMSLRRSSARMPSPPPPAAAAALRPPAAAAAALLPAPALPAGCCWSIQAAFASWALASCCSGRSDSEGRPLLWAHTACKLN